MFEIQGADDDDDYDEAYGDAIHDRR
jgi:hypothetical protein